MPTCLKTPEFAEAWGEWLSYRRASRKPLTPQTQRRQLEQLAQMGVTDAIQCVRQSIERGWQGLFPVKPQTHNANEHRSDSQQHPRNSEIVGSDASWQRTLERRRASGKIIDTASRPAADGLAAETPAS
jgi:hypothetical protein